MSSSLYYRLLKRPDEFRVCTGLRVGRFEKIAAKIGETESTTTGDRNGRKRKIGGGRKHSFELNERVLMYCLYHRLHLTLDLVGAVFGHTSNRSLVCRTVRHIREVIDHIPLKEVPNQLDPDLTYRIRIPDIGKLSQRIGKQGKRIGVAGRFRTEYESLAFLADHIDVPDVHSSTPEPIAATNLQRKCLMRIIKSHSLRSVVLRAKIIINSATRSPGILKTDAETKDKWCQCWQEYREALCEIERRESSFLERSIEALIRPEARRGEGTVSDNLTYIEQVKWEIENEYGGLTREEWERQNELHHQANPLPTDQECADEFEQMNQ
jgi:hypothetical protein